MNKSYLMEAACRGQDVFCPRKCCKKKLCQNMASMNIGQIRTRDCKGTKPNNENNLPLLC